MKFGKTRGNVWTVVERSSSDDGQAGLGTTAMTLLKQDLCESAAQGQG